MSPPKTQASSSKARTYSHVTSPAPNRRIDPIVIIEDHELARQSSGDYNKDDYDSLPSIPVGKEFSPIRSIQKSTGSQDSRMDYDSDSTNLTIKEFNYTVSLIDNKINVLYRLCRFIADQQQETSTALRKLVAADELTDNFWNVCFLT